MSILKVSIRQVKAARALLGWSQSTLAVKCGVSEPTIKRLEADDGEGETGGKELGGRAETIAAIRNALEGAGIRFISHGDTADGPGVALKQK